MTFFLTGATGFVGSHVARVLAGKGARLRLLVRSTSNLANLAGIPAETVVGDLRRPETFASTLAGCDAVFHVAADYRLWVRNPDAMYASNVVGTKDLLRLAREAGVPRFIYTSSVATMGFRSDGTIVNEDTPVSLDAMVGHYKRSKFLAEQEAVAAARAGQQVIILNPTTPIGAGAYVDTGLNLVDVIEVARAHAAALEKGRAGERYILGGENLTLKQMLDKMSAITGLPSPRLRVAHDVAMVFAFFDENIQGRLQGREPRATVEAVRMGRKKMFASSTKAEVELGFQIVPVYQALRSAIEWFRTNGYAPKS
jgi:dihydroflavonol-4-reductase